MARGPPRTAGRHVDAEVRDEPEIRVNEPPSGWCRHWIGRYRPDYVFSGHLHEAPLARGGSWAARVPETGTWCFNPGRIGRESGLVELDTAGRVARWFPSWGREACRSLDLGPAGAATV